MLCYDVHTLLLKTTNICESLDWDVPQKALGGSLNNYHILNREQVGVDKKKYLFEVWWNINRSLIFSLSIFEQTLLSKQTSDCVFTNMCTTCARPSQPCATQPCLYFLCLGVILRTSDHTPTNTHWHLSHHRDQNRRDASHPNTCTHCKLSNRCDYQIFMFR